GLALALPLWAAGALALLAATPLVRVVAARLPRWLDGARRHRVLAGAWVLLGIVAAAQTARLCLFMRDPTRTSRSVLRGSGFFRAHSCLTAYVAAAAFERHGYDTIYDPDLYGGDEWESFIGPLSVDLYEYPPTFLPLPMLASRTGGDYFRLRTLWF